MNLSALLNTPFPRPQKSKKNILGLLLIGCCCSLFIIVYRPFGIENVNGQWYYNLIVFSMGLLFFISIVVVEWGIPSVFPKPFSNWTLGKALLWYTSMILLISAVNFLYKSYLGGFNEFTLAEYFFVMGRTVVISITVSFFILGIFQYINRNKISQLTNQETYLITAQNKSSLRLNPRDILYIKSNDNYVDLHLISGGTREKVLFRSSLKNVEAQIVNPLSPICRCHRGYLINADCFKIQKMTSRSMTLSLDNYSDEVPVSKQYIEDIRQRLSIRH